MDKSNIDYDLKKEIEIGKFLDKYFYKNLNSILNNCEIKDIKRTHDSKKQHRGIDLTIEYSHGKKVNIDEKAAATYFNKGLPTFALEIFFYNKNNELKEGWLFGDKYDSTDSYLFIWGENTGKEIFADNITKIELGSIKKSVLRQDIEKRFNINKENYYNICLDKMNSILKDSKNKDSKEYVKDKKNEAYWKIGNVKERPFLMIYKKNMLKEICQSWFVVTKEEVKQIK